MKKYRIIKTQCFIALVVLIFLPGVVLVNSNYPYSIGGIRAGSMGHFDFTPDLSDIAIPLLKGK